MLTGGPIVDIAWRRLLDRAGARPGLPVTDEPDLLLVVDGARMDPAKHGQDIHSFRLPRVPHDIRIVSRSGVPAELGLARDSRSLGVAVRAILRSEGRKLVAVEAADSVLRDGFHPSEPDNAIRWTNSDAGLPAALRDGFGDTLMLGLRLGCATQYPLVTDPRRAA